MHRFEKEFDGVQDVFELQVSPPTNRLITNPVSAIGPSPNSEFVLHPCQYQNTDTVRCSVT